MRRILALILVLVLALGTFSACRSDKNGSSGSEVTQTQEDSLATVGDEVITAGEMEYAVAIVKNSMTMGMEGQALEDFWNTLIDGVEPVDYVRTEALNLLVDMALLAQAANNAGITVTPEEIDDYFEQNKEMLTGVMENYGVTEDALKAIYRKQLLYDKYAQAVLATDERYNPSEEVLKDYFAKNFYKAQHILKMTVDSQTNAPLSQEEKDAARAEIDNILLAIRDGADFEAMMQEHNQDPGMEQSPEGYVFAEGEMVPEFYEGTVALEENGISEVIETSYGYHIIKRLPLDLEADFAANLNKVQTAWLYAAEDQLVEELRGSVEITTNDAKVKEIPVK